MNHNANEAQEMYLEAPMKSLKRKYHMTLSNRDRNFVENLPANLRSVYRSRF